MPLAAAVTVLAAALVLHLSMNNIHGPLYSTGLLDSAGQGRLLFESNCLAVAFVC